MYRPVGPSTTAFNYRDDQYRDNTRKFVDLLDFLKYKGVEINEQEFNDFIEAKKLAEVLMQDEQGLKLKFSIQETYGMGMINPAAIAKVGIINDR